MQATQYDYIFLGAGCSSLSIIMRMINSKNFPDKKMLVIDKGSKAKNDRTWCFWEKKEGFFESLVFKKWNHLFFETNDKSIPLDIDPYQYKMIRGGDFYKHCFTIIESQKNIDVIYGDISFETEASVPKIKINNEEILLGKKALVFNSVYQPGEEQKGKFYLLQHFKGWIVETPDVFFNPEHAVLMDFRVSQKKGTSFVYLLPLSPTKTLVEYTLFSESILPQAEYNIALKDYLKDYLELDNYEIVEEEFGVIPMTNATFPGYENGMYHIGTAGGQTKPSTGYTFKFIQNQSELIVNDLLAGKVPDLRDFKKRFSFYDSTLLHILSNKLLEGKEIFSILFQKNKAATVLKFLDNETSLSEELKLLNSLPKKVFIKAGLKEFVKMIIS